MTPGVKKLLIAVAALGLVASVVAGRETTSVEPAPPAARIDTRIRIPELDLSRLERPVDEGAKTDIFASRSFSAPEARNVRGKPQEPVAPALPFAYLGRLVEDGKLAVFLARGAESYSVSAGDIIDGLYRVDAVSDAEIRFTYLPLKTQQKLPL
jgi:hypothetical protein